MYVLTNEEVDIVAGGGSAVENFAAICAELTSRYGAKRASQMTVTASSNGSASFTVRLGAGGSRVIRKFLDINGGIEAGGQAGSSSSVTGVCPAGADQAEDEDDKKSKS